MTDSLNIPADSFLTNTSTLAPYFFVGDEAFPLRRNLLRPYSKRSLTNERRIFNYRLSRARRCIENTFGVMVGRFRIFHRVINAYPETVDSIIKAAVTLHNFIKTEETNNPILDQRYCSANYVDTEREGVIQEGGWRKDVPQNGAFHQIHQRVGARNATATAIEFRNSICYYLNYINPVQWQETAANIL